VQWDAGAKQWNKITDFIAPDADILNPLVEADAAAYAAESGITPGCN